MVGGTDEELRRLLAYEAGSTGCSRCATCWRRFSPSQRVSVAPPALGLAERDTCKEW